MMKHALNGILVVLLLSCLLVPAVVSSRRLQFAAAAPAPANRAEVVFWHFWGGAELNVVEEVVRRFNASQTDYVVRAVAMPGNNLDLKLFLSLAGGNPPDVVNIDDPVLADWAERQAILPLTEVASVSELERLDRWLFPAAAKLTQYQGQAFGLCNGLDVRALYYNKSLLDELQFEPPQTMDQLDRIAATVSGQPDSPVDIGFLPAAKNLWGWGIVFGGRFYDETSQQVTLAAPEIAEAVEWMASYGKRYGKLAASLRARDQSLPGKTFPLLSGRYALVVDGQWRARDIRRFRAAQVAAGDPPTEFGVTPLPAAAGQVANAGWINGNYFVLPTGADQSHGAWQFMKFWAGFDGHEAEAAATCETGGWIPVSQFVVDQPAFQEYLASAPLFATFIELAGSELQVPRPNVPGAARFDREVRAIAEQAMDPTNERPAIELLETANERLQSHVDFHRGVTE